MKKQTKQLLNKISVICLALALIVAGVLLVSPMDSIPAELYEAERRQNPGIPSPFDQRTQIIGYITRRLQLLDEIFA